MLYGYYCFGEFTFARESLRLMAQSLRDDGQLELCSPGKVGVTIPSFSAAFVIALYEYLLYSRDRRFAQEILPTAESILRGFLDRQCAENGLIPCFPETPYWNFYEWREGLDGGDIFRDYLLETTYDLPLNALVSMALTAFAEIQRLLGHPEAQQKAQQTLQTLNSAIHARFWNEEHGCYATFYSKKGQPIFSELANSLAVCCGACPDTMIDAVLRKLAEGGLLPVTLGSAFYKYEALMKRPERYGRLVFDEIARVWGNMLFAGATSFWETDAGAWDFASAGSLCHGWAAVPVYYYFAYALGIRPSRDGAAEYTIAAAECGLPGPTGRIRTPEGREVTV